MPIINGHVVRIISGGTGGTEITGEHTLDAILSESMVAGDTALARNSYNYDTGLGKLANPSTLPTGSGYGVAFSSDDTYMAVTHATAPYITIYERSGDTFTKLANPSTLPTSTGQGVAMVRVSHSVRMTLTWQWHTLLHRISPFTIVKTIKVYTCKKQTTE